jgi:hypothetical protein
MGATETTRGEECQWATVAAPVMSVWRVIADVTHGRVEPRMPGRHLARPGD